MSGTSTDNATSNCTVKIIQCMREREGPNQTFTGLDAQGHFEECASQQYPLDPTAALVLGIKQFVILGWYNK